MGVGSRVWLLEAQGSVAECSAGMYFQRSKQCIMVYLFKGSYTVPYRVDLSTQGCIIL